MKKNNTNSLLAILMISILLIGMAPLTAFGLTIIQPIDEIPKIITPVLEIPLVTFKPSAPSNLTAALASNITVKLKWNDNSSNETGFVIQRRVLGTTYQNDLVTLPAGTTTYTDQLTVSYGMFGTVYYQVRAFNSLGNSAYSNEAGVEMLQPTAPSALAATFGSNNAVNLVWNSNSPNLTDYFKIWRKKEGGMFSEVGTTNDSHYIDASVSAGITYYYRIEAVGYFGGAMSSSQGVLVPENAVIGPAVPPIDDNSPIDVSSASDWAEPEILEAYAAGLTTDDIMNNFGKNITRREFSIIAVKLYEALSGEIALVAINNPFSDTTDEDVLKAFDLGIIKGTSATTFSPEKAITRQEICVMITRALKANDPMMNMNTYGVEAFADESQIAVWAIDSVRYASKNGIMKGTGGNNISPLNNTSREQAIVLLKRTYVSFK